MSVLDKYYLKEQEKQQRQEMAEDNFELIITDYWTRERLKRLSYKTGIEDFKILSHWSRSIVSNNFDLKHPDYLEYKAHYQKGDVSWLKKGFTIVDMKKYKKEK